MAGSFACKSNAGVAPQEQLLGTMAGNRRLSIGLPAEHNGGEKRFPLTPEGVALLTKEGYRVCGKRSRRGYQVFRFTLYRGWGASDNSLRSFQMRCRS